MIKKVRIAVDHGNRNMKTCYVDRVVYVSDNKIYFGTHSDLMKRVMSYKELMQH